VRAGAAKVKAARSAGGVKPGRNAWVWLVGTACVAAGAWLAGRDLAEPGVYYDEVIQAIPALEFLGAGGEPPRIPGARAVRVAGRWLPWLTQPYMGALKSQLLIPVFAVAEPGAALLRGTTLAWALLGIPLLMLFANRALGLAVAVIAGALLAVDPSLLFIARHDWGSFSLGFTLRCAALVLLHRGWLAAAPALVAAGGVCVGLGVYNKIDFAVWVAAAAVALLIAGPREVVDAFARRRALLLAGAAGAAVGAAPLVLAGGAVLGVTGAAARGAARAPAWSEKLQVLASVLDGSHFQRLMLVGGRFEAIGDAIGASGGLGLACFAGAALVLVALLGQRRPRSDRDRAALFALATALLTLAGILVTPRAVRAHHFLNAYPFPQLVIATAAALLWTRAAGGLRVPARSLAVALVAATLVSGLRLDLDTLRTLRDTGGRGRWSHAVEDLARDLQPRARVVSLDWGIDAPLRFIAPGTSAEEPIWRLQAGSRAATRLEATPDRVYVLFEPEYAVFPFGSALLEAVAALPAGTAVVEQRNDREGAPVLRVVSFPAPHELVYRGGRFEVEPR
jgi:hypothetical protein